MLLTACAPAPSPGPPGRIVVTVVPAEPDNPLFEPVYRARAIAVDGSLDVGWRLQPGAAPVEVPSGTYRLEAFTVFLSDYMVCADEFGNVGDPGSTEPPNATCFQPTMGPGQVCALDVEVVPGGEVHLSYEAREEGGCELQPVRAGPT